MWTNEKPEYLNIIPKKDRQPINNWLLSFNERNNLNLKDQIDLVNERRWRIEFMKKNEEIDTNQKTIISNVRNALIEYSDDIDID